MALTHMATVTPTCEYTWSAPPAFGRVSLRHDSITRRRCTEESTHHDRHGVHALRLLPPHTYPKMPPQQHCYTSNPGGCARGKRLAIMR